VPADLRKALLTAAVAWIALATACASGLPTVGRTARLPGSRIDDMQRFLVVHREGDPADIENDIRDQIVELGRQADVARELPGDVSDYDAVITYVDRLWWDVTNYCIQLTLYVRDTETGYITATASSRRGSIDRKTPAGHARLMLTELFRREEDPAP
jgi:hypothetical protein